MNADRPPPGWVSNSGVVEPGASVADYAARGQLVKGVCRARVCNRRIELDPAAMCRFGLGGLPMARVRHLWRCNRFEGCDLDFSEEAPTQPLRLEMFVGRPNVRIRLRCRGDRCKFFRVWRVEEIVEGLAKRGQGGGVTEVAKLGGMMTSACPICKRTNWTADLLWINTESMGWKTLGEAAFDGRDAV